MTTNEELEAMGIIEESTKNNANQNKNAEIIENVKNEENSETPVYEIYGNMGTTLKVYENRCVISTTSTGKAFFFGGLTKATRGDKEIYYSDVTSVQFKNLKGTTGYIQFEYPGSMSGNNFTSENSFTFSATIGTNKYYELQKAMPTIYEYIQAKVREYKENKIQGGTVIKQELSSADEIRKFKQLLDDGIITKEEFEAKKKQLLGI